MSWTQKQGSGVKSMLELSTLTGACMVALGERNAGAFGNDEVLLRDLCAAGKTAEEGIWHMPIFEEQREAIKGGHSDLVNIAAGRYGGASSAAAFLVGRDDDVGKIRA